ncbi:polysaccharide deacetylase family protein [Tessaracoccus lubricantis]|uniref:Polysaccharide deacetylase family protein n=1 Tax=Tessaracoccus lubricantis TaxID=545543 RepID=A0ABP9FEM5_9ACTN
MGIARRGVLGLGILGLVGCAPAAPVRPSTPAATPAATAPTPSRAANGIPSPIGPPSSPPPSPASPALPAVSRDDIAARYEGRTPRQWGLEVVGVVQRGDSPSAVLTFDACGGPRGSGYDAALVEVLRSHQVPATLFLNARWIDANPGVAAELAADPLFELANHGAAHRPLSVTAAEAYGIAGTRSAGEVYDEVMGGCDRLGELTGSAPLWFRSGTAHVDDVAVEIVAELGQRVVNFDVNADAGATFSPAQVSRAMGGAAAGSICIGHFNRLGCGTAAGMADALPRLLDGGLRFAQLRDAVPALA